MTQPKNLGHFCNALDPKFRKMPGLIWIPDFWIWPTQYSQTTLDQNGPLCIVEGWLMRGAGKKIGTANKICWNPLDLLRDYGLNYIFFRNKTFVFQDRKLKLSASVWKRISWNLTKLQFNQTTDRKKWK